MEEFFRPDDIDVLFSNGQGMPAFRIALFGCGEADEHDDQGYVLSTDD